MDTTTAHEHVSIDLTDDERSFMHYALIHWHGVANGSPLPITALFDLADWTAFDALTDRLDHAVTHGEPLSEHDWATALLLTEISFGSDLLGAGVEFALVSHSDQDGITLLRALQRKISSHYRANLLFPGAGRPKNNVD